LLLTWFRAKGTISRGAVEGFNNKAKLTMRKPSASAPTPPSRSSTRLASSQNLKPPTLSFDETFSLARFVRDVSSSVSTSRQRQDVTDHKISIDIAPQSRKIVLSIRRREMPGVEHNRCATACERPGELPALN